MNRNAVGVALLVGLTALSVACQSQMSMPVEPSSSSSVSDAPGAGPGGTSLKASPPVAQSPINVTTPTLTPTLVVSASMATYATAAMQYRFRVMDEVGTVAADSGLQNSTTWVLPAPLTPTSKYTWIARPEYRGLIGPWSAAATFTTPVAPGKDYGSWESTCQPGAALTADTVVCVWNFVHPTNSVEDLEVVKRVAWLLRAKGGGLLLKSSGENTVPWLGFTFSASRICFPDGHIYKIIGDAGPGGANSPSLLDNDFVEVINDFPARDPRLR